MNAIITPSTLHHKEAIHSILPYYINPMTAPSSPLAWQRGEGKGGGGAGHTLTQTVGLAEDWLQVNLCDISHSCVT